MGYMNVEVLRASILKSMAVSAIEVMTEDLFVQFWNDVVNDDVANDDVADDDNLDQKGSMHTGPQMIFKTLVDIKNKGSLTKDDIAAIPRDNLKRIARSLDPPHGPVARYSGEDENINKKSHEEL